MDYERSAGGILMPSNDIRVGGIFECQQIRNGEIIDEWQSQNIVVDEGLNHVLDVVFHGATQIATWYLGLFEGNYTPVAGLTAATVTAASTECTAYDEGTRQVFDEAAAASKTITNSASKATFTINASKTIYGAFLASSSIKSGTGGTLFSAARFGSAKVVADDDQLLVSYTFTASSVS